jgi:hypothetical protein
MTQQWHRRDDPSPQRLCTRCHERLPRSAFRAVSRNRDGLSSWCKACSLARTRQWRAANLERINAERRAAYVPQDNRRRIACRKCETMFVTRWPRQVYCSDACAGRVRHRRPPPAASRLARIAVGTR